MGYTKGRVKEIRLGASGHTEVSIVCPAIAIPRPGQYVLAYDPLDGQAPLSTPIFAIEMTTQGYWASPLQPVFWNPGISLDLVGPLGHGFDLPHNIQRLGLVALGDTVSRLVPLIHQVTKTQATMTLFTDLAIPKLTSALEVVPLASLPDALDWPDFLAIDVPLEGLQHLRQDLGLSSGDILSCPVQVLVTSPMPCAGLAQCGACAVQSRRGWKLACEDGPVFDLSGLKW